MGLFKKNKPVTNIAPPIAPVIAEDISFLDEPQVSAGFTPNKQPTVKEDIAKAKAEMQMLVKQAEMQQEAEEKARQEQAEEANEEEVSEEETNNILQPSESELTEEEVVQAITEDREAIEELNRRVEAMEAALFRLQNQ